MLRAGFIVICCIVAWVAVGATQASQLAVSRFREVDKSHSSLGMFSGSTETWRTAVLIVHSTKVIGTGVFSCIRITSGQSLRQCTGSYELPEGEIQLGGLISNRDTFSMIITGATGVYAGKTGTMSALLVGHNPRQALITFYFN